MAGFEFVENIKASPREVFYFLVSVENAPAVVATIRKSEKVGEMPVGLGSKYRQIRSHSGLENETLAEIKEFDAPNLYAVESEKQGIRALYRFELSPFASGTEIRLKAEVKAKGAKQVMAWIVASVMERKDREILAKMKTAIENGEKKEQS